MGALLGSEHFIRMALSLLLHQVPSSLSWKEAHSDHCRCPKQRQFYARGFSQGARGQSRRAFARSSLRVFASSADDLESKVNDSNRDEKELESALVRLDKLLVAATTEDEDGVQAEKDALADVNNLQATGVWQGFGRGAGVPKRQYSLADLRLNNIEPEALLSPTDTTLEGVRKASTFAAVAGSVAAAVAFQWDFADVLRLLFTVLAPKTVDQIVNAGGGEALVLDTIGGVISNEYSERVAQHEAGHFLTAYLLGVLPKGYTLSSL